MQVTNHDNLYNNYFLHHQLLFTQNHHNHLKQNCQIQRKFENDKLHMSKQERNRLHQKKSSYKTIMQKTFLVFILNAIGHNFTFIKRRKSKNIKDYKIEYLKDNDHQIIIDYYTLTNHVEQEMKREKEDYKPEEIKKNVNFKTITLMIDYLDSLGFDVNSSSYKKSDYSLSSNYRIHHLSIPECYVEKIYSALCLYLDPSIPLHLTIINSFCSLHSFPEDSIDIIGEIVLMKDFDIIL